MCLGSKMLYTRSTTTMTMHLEISMPMLEQQLPPPKWSQLIVVKPSPLRVVRVVLEECGDYQSFGDGVWTLDEVFHELAMQLQHLGL